MTTIIYGYEREEFYMENNNNFFNFDDENTFMVIMTFIKQIVGDDAIKEILWDESMKDIDIEELINSTDLEIPYDEVRWR